MFQLSFSDRALALGRISLPVSEDASLHVAEPIRLAVEDALGRGETHYTDRPGILPLRQKTANQLQWWFGVSYDPSRQIVITCSAIESRLVAMQQLLKPGGLWLAARNAERLEGATVIRGLRRSETIAMAGLLYLQSSQSEEEMKEILAGASTSAVVLFEVEGEAAGFHPSKVEGFADRVVTIGGLQHPCWQMGFLAAPLAFAPALRDYKQSLTICSTNLSQWATLAANEEA